MTNTHTHTLRISSVLKHLYIIRFTTCICTFRSSHDYQSIIMRCIYLLLLLSLDSMISNKNQIMATTHYWFVWFIHRRLHNAIGCSHFQLVCETIISYLYDGSFDFCLKISFKISLNSIFSAIFFPLRNYANNIISFFCILATDLECMINIIY